MLFIYLHAHCVDNQRFFRFGSATGPTIHSTDHRRTVSNQVRPWSYLGMHPCNLGVITVSFECERDLRGVDADVWRVLLWFFTGISFAGACVCL